MTDPIADMLTRIRNAIRVGKTEVVVPHSQVKEKLADVIHREGYVSSYRIESEGKFKNLVIKLKYQKNKPAITSLRRISKSGNRVYAGKDNIPVVLNGLGVAVLSTSKGIMTSQQARKDGLGGEILFEIY